MARSHNSNIKEQRARYQRQLSDTRTRLEAEIKRYKSALTNLRTATRKYDTVYTKYVKRPNDNNSEALELALAELRRINAIAEAERRRIDVYLDTMRGLLLSLSEVSDTEDPRQVELTERVSAYISDTESRIGDAEEPVLSALPDALAGRDDEDDIDGLIDGLTDDDEDSPAAPSAAPAVSPEPSIGVTSVTVAPISIDVTPIVERAISAAIDQLSASLETKLRDYVDNLSFPKREALAAAPEAEAAVEPRELTPASLKGVAEPESAVAAEVAPIAAPDGQPVASVDPERQRAVAEVEAGILADELHIYEQLKALYSSLGAIMDGLVEVSTSYATLTARMKEISETQREVNDMQRRTMRDQQGIQAAQKIINDEQLELTAMQRLISEGQEKVKEGAAALAASQSETLAAGEGMAKTQAEITASIEALIATSRSLLDTQRTIEERAARVQQTQASVAEKQAELATRQKETLSTQRRLQKEQRTISQRQPVPVRRSGKSDEADTE